MPITLTINGENATEFLAELGEFLSLKKVPPTANDEKVTEPASDDSPKPRKQRITKSTEPTVEPEDDGLGDAPPKVYTVEEIRAIGREQGQRVGIEKVREYIKSLGAESLPKMDPSLYNTFVEGVVKLK